MWKDKYTNLFTICQENQGKKRILYFGTAGMTAVAMLSLPSYKTENNDGLKNAEITHQNSPSSLKTSPSFLRSSSGINFHSCDLRQNS